MNKTLKGAIVGFIAGLSVAIGGAIKDAPLEGFKPLTFMRSPVVGTLVGAIINTVRETKSTPVLYLADIGAERIVVESYKVIRNQIPSKFVHGEWGMERPTIHNQHSIAEIQAQEAKGSSLDSLSSPLPPSPFAYGHQGFSFS